MHTLTQKNLNHSHIFDQCSKANERKTMAMIILTFVTMGVEISTGILIGSWAWGLLKSSGLILLDGNQDDKTKQAIIKAIECDQDTKVVDLHLWKLSSNSLGALITLVAGNSRSAEEYRSRLDQIHHLDHITIEAHDCMDESCVCHN